TAEERGHVEGPLEQPHDGLRSGHLRLVGRADRFCTEVARDRDRDVRGFLAGAQAAAGECDRDRDRTRRGCHPARHLAILNNSFSPAWSLTAQMPLLAGLPLTTSSQKELLPAGFTPRTDVTKM